jgi:hypothetical protein
MPLLRRPILVLAPIALLAGLIAACGASSSGVTIATVTPLPTTIPTPVPCTTWRIIPSPNPSQSQPIVLSGVSAITATDAWAVGGSGTNSTSPGEQTLIERWDGTAWHLVSSPPADYLHGIAVIGPSDVWAVGGELNYGNGHHPYKPLIEHWNGSQWSIVPGGTTTFLAIELDGVAALAPNDVWAVGVVDVSGGTYRPLMEHWNGTAWQAMTGSVPTGATGGTLAAVTTIPGTNQLWAVGSLTQNTAPNSQGLIEQWDGTAWRIIAAPTLPGGAHVGPLSGVVALSRTDAWAVGDSIGSDGNVRPLILRWNGAAWQVVPSPDAPGSLLGVAAAGAYDVRAVGTDATTGQALVEQWDGAAWHVVTSPIPSGATKSALHSVTADSAGSFWAVGSAQTAAGTSQTLIERCP